MEAKKVVIKDSDYGIAHCPTCDCDVHGIGQINYCPNCGQALKWPGKDFVPPVVHDKLDKIFAEQLALQEKLGYNIANMPATQRTAYIKEYSLHLVTETGEMLKELPFFKPWKKYSSVDPTKAREEFADMIHFFVIVALGLGITSEHFYELYMNKNAINYNRQKDTTNYKPCVDKE